MADEVTVEGDGSKANVAFKLFNVVMRAELGNALPKDRNWVLQAYVDCLRAVIHGKVPGA